MRSRVHRLILPVLVSLLAGCSLPLAAHRNAARPSPTPRQGSPTAIPASTHTPEISYQILVNPILLTEFEALVRSAEAILSGRIVAKERTIYRASAGARTDPSGAGVVNVIQVYSVQVERYLKGAGSPYIYLLQLQSYLRHPARATDPNLDQLPRVDYEYTRLQLDRPYLMFLHQAGEDVLDSPGAALYAPAAHPWLFDLHDPGCVRVEDFIPGLAEYYPPRTYTETVVLIMNPPAAKSGTGETRLPAPTSAARCPSGK